MNEKKPVTMQEGNKSVSMQGTYRTVAGHPVRVLCTDFKANGYPVIVVAKNSDDTEVSYTCDKYGQAFAGPSWNLIEYNPLQELDIDTKILVRDRRDDKWIPRHFAGISADGLAMTWIGGQTSFSIMDGNNKHSWDFWKLPE